ncbi:hypothetical protein BDB00DRAFT_871683 [Zychaea mexicana]|uniref:uncharacterized protein n=1 Tax=Zychaea mexicana TaxID=64656 RepID=UPI0022FDCCCD|nr:uncharacterized protein BDB00DRAFT_871683 [Zychaea mexicana]KAI9494159.1 hypothetical protein BDB00DRAFT_871683 [Zychaea mexicana]
MKRTFDNDSDEAREQRQIKSIRTIDSIQAVTTTMAPVNDCNAVVYETTASIIELLTKRATAHEKLGRVNDALDDAHLIIVQSPTRAQGYLLAGNVYSNQGRERQAVQILQTGLQQVVASSERQQLEFLLARSKHRLEQRIDFVSLLPAEITSMIWVWLGINESLVEAMLVSKTWRAAILQSHHVWRTIRTHSVVEIDTAIATVMPVVGEHVQHLRLQNVRRYYDSPHLTYFNYMIQGTFCNLKSLLLDARVDANLLSMALSKVKHTLTKLEIVYDMLLKEEAMEENAILPLPDVLDICPNLLELKYVMNGQMGLTRKERTIPTVAAADIRRSNNNNNEEEDAIPCAIRRLDIFQHLVLDDEEIITVNQLHRITRRCRHLRLITLRNFNMAYLDMLERDCPDLRHVHFINHETDVPDNVRLLDRDGDHGGLQTLSILSDPVRVPTLWPYLFKQGKTLESVSLFMDASAVTGSNMQSHGDGSLPADRVPTLGEQVLPALKKLVLLQHADDTTNEEYTTSLIQRCPMLETFSMFGGRLYKSCFRALRQASQLKSLALQATSIESGGLQAFLCHYQQQQQDSCSSSLGLQQFRAYFVPVKELCLDALADIKTLERIRINCYLTDDRAYQKQVYWDPFMVKLRDHPSLQALELDAIEFVSDKDLIALAEISSLKRIMLQRLSLITDQGLKAMIEKVSGNHLKCVQVFECINISKEAVEYARKACVKRGGHLSSCVLQACCMQH